MANGEIDGLAGIMRCAGQIEGIPNDSVPLVGEKTIGFHIVNDRAFIAFVSVNEIEKFVKVGDGFDGDWQSDSLLSHQSHERGGEFGDGFFYVDPDWKEATITVKTAGQTVERNTLFAGHKAVGIAAFGTAYVFVIHNE
jgi:hypothetical protein